MVDCLFGAAEREIEVALGSEAFQADWQRGQQMTLEEAIQEAVGSTGKQ